MSSVRSTVLVASLILGLALPGAAFAAGGPAPADACVPGTVWEDPASGVKYLCIYDEAFGGPRWVLLSEGQRGSSGMPYRSSVDGCLHLAVGLSAHSGGGADAVARTYRWPWTSGTRLARATGDLRARVVIQRYGSVGWSTCRDSGYLYNSVVAYGWVAGVDMGAAADCGSGSYRAIGYGGSRLGAAWRSGSFVTTAAWLP